MPKRFQRSMKRVHVKTTKYTKLRFKEEKKGKPECGLCHAKLRGVVSGNKTKVKSSSKSGKRPSALLAGILCNNCRLKVIEEAIKTKNGIKKMEDTEIALRKYIEQAMSSID